MLVSGCYYPYAIDYIPALSYTGHTNLLNTTLISIMLVCYLGYKSVRTSCSVHLYDIPVIAHNLGLGQYIYNHIIMCI